MEPVTAPNSIGNYKGVMLCNRPNDMGLPAKAEAATGVPFNSRVNPSAPLGWNPSSKLPPKMKKKKPMNGVLLRHRVYLKNLETKKNNEREEIRQAKLDEEEKVKVLKDIAERQRVKVKQMKEEAERETEPEEPVEMEFEEPTTKENKPPALPTKLTSENLSNLDAKSQRSKKSLKSAKSSKRQKPAWAVTEKQLEDEKEAEIDELIDFAYDLDYEKYLEDYEVRQALAIIKDRVTEIKKDQDWKENMTNEMNATKKTSEKTMGET